MRNSSNDSNRWLPCAFVMNAPIKYFGGKNGMFGKILPHFPNKEEYTTYIEPFGGSYAIGFHMDHVPMVEIYNDMNNNVYTLYKVLADKEKFAQFKQMCDLYPYSEQFRYDFKEKLKQDDITDVERAFSFFYVNRTSHNGIGGLSVNMVVRRNMCKSISDYLSAVDNLEAFHQRMSRMVIMHRDGVELMRRYRNYEDVFMYCDPPYVQETRGETRYETDMDDEGHKRFVDECIESKAKLLISGYDNELYAKLTDNGFTRVDFEVNAVDGTPKKKKKTESLWKNY